MEACPCDKGGSYDACCGSYHAGGKAPTAVALMRSRYVAFVRNNLDYIKKTMHGQALAEYEQGARIGWSSKDHWQKLEIVCTESGEANDHTGSVTFKASYSRDGQTHIMHEISQFEKIDDRWFYCSGEPIMAKVEQVVSKKFARNDPCLCGSGKKYKKCCGG